MRRRNFLIGSGMIAGLTAGIASPGLAEEPIDGDLPDTIKDAARGIPSPDLAEIPYLGLYYQDLDDITDSESIGFELEPLALLDIDVEKLAAAIVAIGPESARYGVAIGEFSRPENGDERETTDDWWIGDEQDQNLTNAATDDAIAFALDRDDDRRRSWIEVIPGLLDDERDSILAAETGLIPILELLESHSVIHILFVDEAEHVFREDDPPARILAIGSDDQFDERTGIVEDTWALEPLDEATIEESTFEAVIEEMDQGHILELAIDSHDEIAYADVVLERPPRRDGSAAPSANFRLQTDVDHGETIIRHDGREDVDADDLELWIDGERYDTQPSDEYDTITEGDELVIDTGPIASVILRWIDEEDGVYAPYLDRPVGADAFDIEYAPENRELTFHYIAEESTTSEQLHLEVHRDDHRRESDPIELPDTFETGDAVAIDNFDLNALAQLRLDIPSDPGAGINPNTALHSYRPTPPRARIGRSPDEPPEMIISSAKSIEPDDIRVEYDGEPIDSLPADIDDESIPLEEAAFGTEITVFWEMPSDPYVLTEHVITPIFDVEFIAGSDGMITCRHTGGETVATDNLAIHAAYDDHELEIDDLGENFAVDDEIAVSAPMFEQLSLVWQAENAREYYGQITTGQSQFMGVYDPDDESVEIKFVGEREGDAVRVGLGRNGVAAVDGDDRVMPFVNDGNAIEPGQSVTISDVDIDERLFLYLAERHDAVEDDDVPDDAVDVEVVDDPAPAPRPMDLLWEFQPLPQRRFRFDPADESVLVKFTGPNPRDAATFEIHVDDETADTQFSDEFDELSDSDSVPIEPVDIGETITVYWTKLEEPKPVASFDMPPTATFDVSVDRDAQEAMITHESGAELDASSLEVWLEPPAVDPGPWDNEGTVKPGDSQSFEIEGDLRFVVLFYDGSHVLHEEEFDKR